MIARAISQGAVMPVHDWTRVPAGIFHDFHHEWISTIKHTLNRGILPPDHYALAEQLAGGLGPDVLTLEGPTVEFEDESDGPRGGVALAATKPKVSFHAKTEEDIYATKAKRIAIRHVSGHRVVAVLEIVSPGNKSTRSALRDFAEKAAELLRGGIHLLVVDIFPPSKRDPQGIHKAIWDEISEDEFVLPADRPLTTASYIGGMSKEAFIEPLAQGSPLPEMPLFLTSNIYVRVPLEVTYQAAWDAVPGIWQKALQGAR
jgi:hypothetical protein